MSNIFLNRDHQLRPGWKFATYVAFVMFFYIAANVAVALFYGPRDFPDDPLSLLALTAIIGLIPAIAALVLSVQLVDRRPFRTFGIGLFPGWQTGLTTGLGIGAVMAALVFAGCYLIGYVSIAWSGDQSSIGTLAGTLIVLVIAAANEELLFRGYPLQVLMESIGEWPAIIGMSLLFGLLHVTNPNASVVGVANTVVAGIMLSLAYVRTRSLWFPYGIHLTWNAGLGFILGFRLSGMDLPSLWTTGIAGSDTILGGGYGPEDGLLATFIFGGAAVLVNRRKSDTK